MKIHVLWRRHQTERGGIGLRGLEWFFLLFGLAALDTYIWINTTTILYQAYENWVFEQALRGQQPSIPGFARDKIRFLLGREPPKAAKEETPRRTPESDSLSSSLDARRLIPSAVIGRLEIPNLHLTAMVREGVDAGTLRRAVGHIPGTALPGGRGNVGLAGHRDTFFRALRNIQEGDAIELQTGNGSYRYAVESTRVVKPHDIHVLDSSTKEILTLVTCYPFYYLGSAPDRFVVRAALVAVSP